MRISVFLSLLVMSCLMLGACQEESSQQQVKIAVADVARLMRDSVPGKEGIKFLEAQQNALRKELETMQEKLDKNPEDEAAIKEFQRVYATSQQRLQDDGQNVAGAIYDSLQRCMDNFREKNGYEVILSLETVASYNPAIDVTSQILAEFDKQKIEFKSLSSAVDTVKNAPESVEKEDMKKPAEEPAENVQKDNSSPDVQEKTQETEKP